MRRLISYLAIGLIIFTGTGCALFKTKRSNNPTPPPISTTGITGEAVTEPTITQIKNFMDNVDPGTTVKIKATNQMDIEITRQPE